MMRFALCALACTLTVFVIAAQQPAPAPKAAERAIDFQREIRPILSDNCFHCHGPDKETRMADLRLDTKEGALSVRKSGSPVTPGSASKSLIYQRITAASKAQIMPPVHSRRTLTTGQKDLIRQWIEQGAPWKEHWAFVPPARPALPAVTNVRW